MGSLRPGAHQNDLVVGQVADTVDVDQRVRRDLQVAQFAGHVHVADHGTAHECDLAPVLGGHIDHLLDAMDVTGETGDDHPFLGAGPRPARSAGRISDSDFTKPLTSALVESTSSRSTPSEPSLPIAVRSVIRPSRGSWSILKSPVWMTRPAVVSMHPKRIGDRVVHRQELDPESTQPLRVTLLDHLQRGFCRRSRSFASGTPA